MPKGTTRVAASKKREAADLGSSEQRIETLERLLKASEARNLLLEQKLDDFMKTTEGKISLLSQEHIQLAENSKLGLGKERSKRLDLFQKIHKFNTDEFDKINTKLDSDRLDHASFAREVMLVREIIDDLFYKRYGITNQSSPTRILSSSGGVGINNGISNLHGRGEDSSATGIFSANKALSSLYTQGFEKINILDHLSMRIATLEAEVMGSRNYHHNHNHHQQQQQQPMQFSPGFDASVPGSMAGGLQGRLSILEEKLRDISHNDLKKKIKELGESTAKTCQALSSGLSEMQQTNISFMSWADKAHVSIGICADKLGFHGNPCPPLLGPSSSSSSSNHALHSVGSSSYSPLQSTGSNSGGLLHMSRASAFGNSPMADPRRRAYGLDS